MNTVQQKGFTLIEIAITLAIIGIIMAGLFTGMSAMRETTKYKEDQAKLQDIKDALLNFVAVNNYLPCPDTDNDGLENREADGSCSATSGDIPYLALATHSKNAYNQNFSYQVNRTSDAAPSADTESANYFYSGCSTPPCFKASTFPTVANNGNGNFSITDGAASTPTTYALHIPLVVISHGVNGCSGVSGRENDNCSTTATTYYQAPQSREGANRFDDVLIWVSSLEIKRHTTGILAINGAQP